jgi:hypothetical protein
VRKRLRLRAAAAVFVVTAIAACYSIDQSSIQSPVWITGSGSQLTYMGSQHYSYDFGTVSMGTFTSFSFTPQGEFGTGTDDYNVDSVSGSGACSLFPLSASGGPISGGGSVHVFHSPDGTCPAGTNGAFRFAPLVMPGIDCDYNFTGGFTAAQPNSASCDYDFAVHDSVSSSHVYLTLRGSGAGGGSGIDVNPTSLVMSAPAGGGLGGAQTTTLKNLGSGSENGSAYLMGMTTNFSVSPALGPWNLSGGSSVPYDVRCSGLIAGTAFGTLVFQPSNGSAQSVTLECDIYNSGGLVVTGSPNFDPTLVGSAAMPTPQVVNLSYSGLPMQLVSFSRAGSATTNGVAIVPPDGTSILMGQGATTSVDISVSWTPTGPASGSIGAINISFAGNTIPVPISGIADTADVVTDPTSIDFGPVCADQMSAPRPLHIYNTGGMDVNLVNMTPPGAPFAFSPVLTNTKVEAGHHNEPSTMVTVMPIGTGPQSSTLTLNLDNQAQPHVDVMLKANAIQANIEATPGALDFGTAPVQVASNRQSFVLTNCSSGALTITADSITNMSDNTVSADFTLQSPSPPEGTIAMADSRQFVVGMTAQTPGPKSALLTLTHNAGTTTIMLVGSGADTGSGSTTEPKDRQTYYACSTGKPVSLAPIALALLALRRRRR